MEKPTLDSPDLYTIGWITALSIELAAATALLDQEHEAPEGFVQHSNDNNAYTWGRIGKHNVVIASLPAGIYGTNPAAIAASHLRFSLPDIKIGLFVGIGGGISRPAEGRDIRLGDIVVSQPAETSGGVIQYDLGKAKSNQNWECKGHLDKPPIVLLNALKNLQAKHELEASKVPELLTAMLKGYPLMAKPKNKLPAYVHQGFENDRLFVSSYEHKSTASDCSVCDLSQQVDRDDRDSTDPEIHYGIIASGNTLVKDAATRDSIAKIAGSECLCVEMEAAGLMSHFPCLVIRGICDYADSHKNDRWQRYASATAAAFAKELLGRVPVQGLRTTPRIGDVLKSVNENLESVKSGVQGLRQGEYDRRMKEWLSPPDLSLNFNRAKESRHPGTGKWFLESSTFRDWESGKRSKLWLHAGPGSGKTVLMTTVVDHLRDGSRIVLPFYFDFRDKSKTTVDSMLHCVVSDLCKTSRDCRHELDSLYKSCGSGGKQPDTDSLSISLVSVMSKVKCPKDVYIVIDALDECTERKSLLRRLKQMFDCPETRDIHLLATSRQEQDLQSGLSEWIPEDNRVALDKAAVNSDIRLYLGARLDTDEGFRRWSEYPDVLEEIKLMILEKADGMFRWAACQLDLLEDCLTYDELKTTMETLPSSMNETYARILDRIPEIRRDKAIRLLQLLLYAEEPLTVSEVIDAIAVRLEDGGEFNVKSRLPDPNDIFKFCPSLCTIAPWPGHEMLGDEYMFIQLAHFSVKEYLLSTALEGPFRQVFSAETSHACIAQVCMSYLCCVTYDSEPVHPFTIYSIKYWAVHARHVQTLDHVHDKMLAFFENKEGYEYWNGSFLLPSSSESMTPDEGYPPLHFACFAGLVDIVRILLGRGADIEEPFPDAKRQGDLDGRRLYYPISVVTIHLHDILRHDVVCGTALMAAAAGGNENIVNLLLERGAYVNARNKIARSTALHAAAERGAEGLVKLLLDEGAEVNAQDRYSQTALYIATESGNEALVRMLLDAGADTNIITHEGSTALKRAAYSGHRNILRMLLDNGADVDYYGGKGRQTALQVAAWGGHDDIVRDMLDRGANVNEDTGHGTALQNAAFYGYETIVRMLLEAGADVNKENRMNETALQGAAQRGKKDIVRILLDRGANVNEDTGHGTALQNAAFYGYETVVRVLLEAGADVNKKDKFDRTALQRAVTNDRKHVVRTLLEKSAEMDSGDVSQALHQAFNTFLLFRGSGTGTVSALLYAGADINSVDPKGTPLQKALEAKEKGKALVKILLQMGADVNKRSDDVEAPLELARQWGDKEIIQALLEVGAIDGVSDEGRETGEGCKRRRLE
ncbi:hypothetical protein CP533_1689 [Ophiocordyceps camponoti-saundersi (nom. inval.)]|nr:hypothetical protein CP533_1689 [Ophiocordyceps camponoti-saundersi (nom. inval.)]